MKSLIALLVAFWFIACSIFVLWLGTVSKSDFDPELKLSQALMDLEFEQSLYSMIQNVAPNKAGARIIHVTQNNCYCDWLAEPHQNSLNKWAKEHGYATANLSLSNSPQLASYIPSTPAVIAFDQDNKLIYMGPYSRGSGCFAQSGKIDEQLANWELKNNTQLKQAIVDTDATGCYCNYST